MVIIIMTVSISDIYKVIYIKDMIEIKKFTINHFLVSSLS